MILRKRLVIFNAATFILPMLITIVAALIYIFINSSFLHMNLGYGNIKSLAERRFELFKTDSSLIQSNSDLLFEKDFQEYLASRFKGIDSDIIAMKKQEVIFSTGVFNKIDIEKCLNATKNHLFANSVSLGGIPYIVRAVPLVFTDGNQGNAILLAETKKEDISLNSLLLFTGIVFIFSFLITNISISFMLSRSISKPLEKLKTAAGEISRGNLAYEVIEDGDNEIRELCNSFEQMRLKLKESVQTQMKYDDNRKMLISSISHDLRTPITSIKGYINGILDGVANTPEKEEKYLKTVYSKASQVDAMIDDLLLYSKLDLSQIPFNFEETDIVKYFQDCIIECSPELEKANIRLMLEDEIGTPAIVLLDREKMRRVINNIIDNAQKYMNKPSGKILIILRKTASSFIIEIRDNGAGISREHLLHIFDRFYRADASRSKIAGSGLGLAIAKQIVEGHEGKIWAISRKDEGTSILISLKAVQDNRSFAPHQGG